MAESSDLELKNHPLVQSCNNDSELSINFDWLSSVN
jgi:hypothetical protein